MWRWGRVELLYRFFSGCLWTVCMRLLSVKRGYFVHFCLSLLVRVYRFCSHFCSQKSRCLIWDYTTCNLWLIGPCVSDSLTLVSCYFVRWCLSLFVVFHRLCCHFL